MKKEQQIDFQLEDWPVQADGIVIGDEGCIYRALAPVWRSWVEKAVQQGLTIRYVTPPVPERYVAELFWYIENLSALTRLKVTFNDLGMLYRCKELIDEELVIPALGRIITRSMIDCPWHQELLQQEDPDLAAAVSGSNLVHPAKWELLRKFKISDIELNMNNFKDAAQLRASNLALTGYGSNTLVSVGRVCFSAKWQGLDLPQCVHDARCRKKLSLEIERQWGKMKLLYENPSPWVKEKFHDLYIRGNIVYRQQMEVTPEIPEDFFDCIIF